MKPKLHQSFYADIEAARLANVPVELCSRGLLQSTGVASPSKVRELAAATEQDLSGVDDRHQAAIGVHQQLGSMVPVLDGLSARALARREFAVVVRRVLWYLTLVLLLALLGLLYFYFHIVPEYELVRRDIQMYHGVTEFNSESFRYLVPLMVAVAVLLLVTLVLLLAKKTNLVMGWFGGRKYVRYKVSSAAVRTLGLLASKDVSLNEAAGNTATLYALDKVGQKEFSKSFGEATDAETYQILSQYWSLQAAKTFERARTIVPVVVLTVVGGSVVLAYGVLVYGPLVGLIRDLIKSGVSS